MSSGRQEKHFLVFRDRRGIRKLESGPVRSAMRDGTETAMLECPVCKSVWPGRLGATCSGLPARSAHDTVKMVVADGYERS